MLVNVNDFIKSKISQVSASLGAVFSLSEQISSAYEKLSLFCSGIGSYCSLYIQSNANNPINRVVALSQSSYANALDNPDMEISLPCNGNGGSVTVTGESILNAVEDQLTNLRCQQQFLQYTLNNDTPTSAGFISKVRDLCPDMPGNILERFGQYIINGGSAIDAIKNFIQSYVLNDIDVQEVYISLADPSEYIGSIWTTAWSVIGNVLSDFFEGVWDHIKKIKDFFNALLFSVIKIGEWIVGKFYGNLLSMYTQASNAVVGLLDVPIMQIQFDSLTVAAHDLLPDSYTGYSWDGLNHKYTIPHYTDQAFDEWIDRLEDGVRYMCTTIFDGKVYKSVTEVVVPSEPFNIAFRVGYLATNTTKKVLTASIVSNFGDFSAMSDDQKASNIWLSLKNALQFISSIVPFCSSKQDVDDTSIHWTDYAEIFMTLPNDEKVVNNLHYYGETLNNLPTGNDAMQIIFAILTYMCMSSKGFGSLTTINGSWTWIDSTDRWISMFLYPINGYTYQLTPTESEFINELSNDYDSLLISNNVYRAYATSELLPYTIHMQTVREQSIEWIKDIGLTLLAVVAVVVAAKALKAIKNRRIQRTLVHADVDRLSWDVGANPTAENIAKFEKAFTKARHFDFVDRIMGMAVGGVSSLYDSLKSTVQTIIASKRDTDNKLTAQSTDINDHTSTGINTIKTLIKG